MLKIVKPQLLFGVSVQKILMMNMFTKKGRKIQCLSSLWVFLRKDMAKTKVYQEVQLAVGIFRQTYLRQQQSQQAHHKSHLQNICPPVLRQESTQMIVIRTKHQIICPPVHASCPKQSDILWFDSLVSST